VPVGLSDHSGTIFPGLAAVALGASVIEVHLTLSRDHFGPDVPVSLTPDDLARLTEGAAFVRETLDHPLDKDREAERLAPMRDLFTRSLVVRRDIEAGTVLTDDDLALKKPGTGLPDARRTSVVGRTARRNLAADHLLTLDDLEPEVEP
jgi:N-acetylneuraminate synthase